MVENTNPNSRKKFAPPNLIAFIFGVMLAVMLGHAIRNAIENLPTQPQGPLRLAAKSAESTNPNTSAIANTERLEEPSSAAMTPIASPRPEENALPRPTANITPAPSPEDSPKPIEDEIDYSPRGEVDYLAWREQLRVIEESLIRQGTQISSVTLTPRYRHKAKGLAVTRGQFLDIVSRKVPANLPTRQSNQGIVLQALSPSDFDIKRLNQLALDSGIRLEPLCAKAERRSLQESPERITIIIENSQSVFKCLREWLSNAANYQGSNELTLIGLTQGTTFYGSITAQNKFISLQMWKPEWLMDNTVGVEGSERDTDSAKRTLRLANVLRALSQPSDVRMQVPASSRSLKGPFIEPKNPTSPKPLVIGNFALLPSHMPRGAVIASTYSSASQFRSKKISVTPPGPGRARALILATQGKKLHFMTIYRD